MFRQPNLSIRHSQRPDAPKVDSVIIFRIGSIGDTVVALPCFHHIARCFRNSRRILVTDIPGTQKAAPAESVLENSGLIDDVIYFPPPPRKLSDLIQLRERILNTNCTTLIYVADRGLSSTLRDICFFKCCGIKRVIGAPIKRDLRYPRVDALTGLAEYESERLARCLSSLGHIDLGNREFWDLRLKAEEIRTADRALSRLGGSQFFSINLGGKVTSKDWGDSNWTHLFRLLAIKYARLGVIFIGSVDEFERSDELAMNWVGSSVNLCGRLSPRESAAAMRNSVCFVGHDSGPMHLAAAVGVPCVCVFGGFNRPRTWHPMGDAHKIIHNMAGVREIRPEDVYAAIARCSRAGHQSGLTHVTPSLS
jgi:heptosyltransferase III